MIIFLSVFRIKLSIDLSLFITYWVLKHIHQTQHISYFFCCDLFSFWIQCFFFLFYLQQPYMLQPLLLNHFFQFYHLSCTFRSFITGGLLSKPKYILNTEISLDFALQYLLQIVFSLQHCHLLFKWVLLSHSSYALHNSSGLLCKT